MRKIRDLLPQPIEVGDLKVSVIHRYEDQFALTIRDRSGNSVWVDPGRITELDDAIEAQAAIMGDLPRQVRELFAEREAEAERIAEAKRQAREEMYANRRGKKINAPPPALLDEMETYYER